MALWPVSHPHPPGAAASTAKKMPIETSSRPSSIPSSPASMKSASTGARRSYVSASWAPKRKGLWHLTRVRSVLSSSQSLPARRVGLLALPKVPVSHRQRCHILGRHEPQVRKPLFQGQLLCEWDAAAWPAPIEAVGGRCRPSHTPLLLLTHRKATFPRTP
jgi:hypothetical protein